MRRIRYQVACSLDGFIAGPNDEFDWIPMDPDIDFGEIQEQFDTLLMGRRTYEAVQEGFPGMKTIVISRSLRPEDHPEVEIVAGGVRERVEELRRQPGKDVWLFGGGELFRSLEMGCVDTVEPAIVPILLGDGRPFLPSPAVRRRLKLKRHRVYDTSGIVVLEYDVLPG